MANVCGSIKKGLKKKVKQFINSYCFTLTKPKDLLEILLQLKRSALTPTAKECHHNPKETQAQRDGVPQGSCSSTRAPNMGG